MNSGTDKEFGLLEAIGRHVTVSLERDEARMAVRARVSLDHCLLSSIQCPYRALGGIGSDAEALAAEIVRRWVKELEPPPKPKGIITTPNTVLTRS